MKVAPWNDPNMRWVCEDHPTKDQSHRLFFGLGPECGGAGMPEPHENRGHICSVGCLRYQMNVFLDNISLSSKLPYGL